MFEAFETAPADPILGLTEAFNKDTNSKKINLGVGVYKDAVGKTPVLATVKRVEERILEEETSKSYLSIDGTPAYGAAVQRLLFGAEHEIVTSGRAATLHTPGGTGGVRVAADFIRKMFPGAHVWLSEPTWVNHPNIFHAAGLAMATYPYYDAESKSLVFDKMMAALEQVPAGDVVVLHGCCHNPTGADPTPDQWEAIADVAARQVFLPLVDFAYQGFGDGIEADATSVRVLSRGGAELLIANSFSKNLGLYRERVGALTIVGATEKAAQKALGHAKSCARTNYSTPPSHGGAIVTVILTEPDLRREWEGEVTVMRDRINWMRRRFVEALKAKGAAQDFSFLTGQRGMFSFSGLTRKQVERLRTEYSIYIVNSGRINVAAITESSMDYLCQAIAKVL